MHDTKHDKPEQIPVSQVRADLCSLLAQGPKVVDITVQGTVRATLRVHEDLPRMEA